MYRHRIPKGLLQNHRLLRYAHGQSLTEYGLLLALVVVVSLTALNQVGGNIKDMLNSSVTFSGTVGGSGSKTVGSTSTGGGQIAVKPGLPVSGSPVNPSIAVTQDTSALTSISQFPVGGTKGQTVSLTGSATSTSGGQVAAVQATDSGLDFLTAFANQGTELSNVATQIQGGSPTTAGGSGAAIVTQGGNTAGTSALAPKFTPTTGGGGASINNSDALTSAFGGGAEGAPIDSITPDGQTIQLNTVAGGVSARTAVANPLTGVQILFNQPSAGTGTTSPGTVNPGGTGVSDSFFVP